MTDYERKKIELELKSFIAKNFDRPMACKNLEQIRFYVRELSLKIEALEKEYAFVPDFVFTLLTQYNERQNILLTKEFKNSYC